ncbi:MULTISPECIES: glycerate kinase [unclassified Ruegeria]|uniref:glycerate kinase type-2 family protein n=1 Tax=unclassified Ruegeria TaxID=2625375 RepID=UPI001487AE88|nr:MULTISPECIES: glycerate kinase [unclassified Ruegeria]
MAEPESLLRSMFSTAVATADPMQVIPAQLPEKPPGRVVVIGAGKASARMAEAVEHVWGPCEGLIITRYGYARPTQGVQVIEASHPVADEAGQDATAQLLALVASLGEDDFVLALMSGGASALLCAPAGDLTLSDKQEVHRALLSSGAPIGAMNTVRKHLSHVKGGQLAAAAYPATLLSLAISDVPGDDPTEIGSGATVGEASSVQDVWDIVERHSIDLPPAARAHLQRNSSTTVAPDDTRLSKTTNIVVAAPSQSLAAAGQEVTQLGFDLRILGDALEGEARELGAEHAQLALSLQAGLGSQDAPIALLSGGECTVSGNQGGIGGPNAEYALAAAIALKGQPGIWGLACDTDGVDGAAEVAGAVFGPHTLDAAARTGVDPGDALARNDAHSFFEAVGSQVVTGPTLTNVNDFRAILIFPHSEE